MRRAECEMPGNMERIEIFKSQMKSVLDKLKKEQSCRSIWNCDRDINSFGVFRHWLIYIYNK